MQIMSDKSDLHRDIAQETRIDLALAALHIPAYMVASTSLRRAQMKIEMRNELSIWQGWPAMPNFEKLSLS
jgi:hypothetical protein